MQKSTNLKKRASENSSSKTTQKISTEIAESSKKAVSNEGSRFSSIFQKLVCSNSNLTDDESEIMVIPRSGPK